MNDVSFYSLQSALASAFTHRNVNSFIARDDLFGCGAQYITTMKGQVIANRNVKDEDSKIIT